MSKVPPGGRSLLSFLLAIVAPIVAVAGVLAAVIAIGRYVTPHTPPTPVDSRKLRLVFADISCMPPPGMTREAFLGEVQFYAEKAREPVPDLLELAQDPVLKLKPAFLRHPWVEQVDEITLLPDGRLRAGLRYRTPVLAVEDGDQRRAVDGNGIRLPDAAATDGLPVLRTTSKPHARAGAPWGDEQVEDAARVAGFLRDLPLGLKSIDVKMSDVVLTTKKDAKIIWGRAPGKEATGEEKADRKRERLRAAETPSDLRRPG